MAFVDEPMFLSLARYDLHKDRTPDVDGQLVSSYLDGSSLHAPVLDIDVPIRLIPSSTDGHSHLYIDVPMHRITMFVMLGGLMVAGVVEPGFFWWSLRRGGCFVRRPGVVKTEDESMKYTYGMFFKLRNRGQ